MAGRLDRALSATPRSVKRVRWASDPCDDIQGPRRVAIIKAHLDWLVEVNTSPVRPGNEYALQDWLTHHKAVLARARRQAVGYYRNTKAGKSKTRGP